MTFNKNYQLALLIFLEQYVYQTLEETSRNAEGDVTIVCKSKFYQLPIKYLTCESYEKILELALNKL